MVIRIEEYNSSKKSDWDLFVTNHGSCWFDSLSSWIEYLCDHFGYTNCSFMIYDEDTLVGVFPLYLVKNFLGCRLISGPIFDRGGPFLLVALGDVWSGIEKHLDVLAKKYTIDYLELRSPLFEIPNTVKRSDYVDFTLDLTRPLEEIEKSVKRDVRRSLEKSARSLVVSSDDNLKLFYSAYLQTMKRLGSPPFSVSFFSQLCGQDSWKSLFLFAHKGSELTNACHIMIFGDEAKYEFGASCHNRNLQGNTLLLFEAIKKCKNLGVKKFLLGRTLRGSSVYSFKQRWNAEESTIDYYYKLYRAKTLPSDIRDSTFGFVKHIWQLLPVGISSRIGDYFRKIVAM